MTAINNIELQYVSFDKVFAYLTDKAGTESDKCRPDTSFINDFSDKVLDPINAFTTNIELEEFEYTRIMYKHLKSGRFICMDTQRLKTKDKLDWITISELIRKNDLRMCSLWIN